MTVYILGAGPAGLALTDALAHGAGQHVVVLERDSQAGGLARTVRWDDASFDLGPHKIFTRDQALMERVLGLLPRDQWLERPKKGSIFMRGHFLPYPPSPTSLVSLYGVVEFLRMGIDYAIAQVRSLLPSAPPRTFEADLSARVGRRLYEVLFKQIALKLWGDPANLDVKLSRGRVQIPSLPEIIGLVLGFKKKDGFEALTFHYPRGGLQRLWDAIIERSREHAEVRLGQRVVRLVVQDRRVTAIEIDAGGTVDTIALGPDDYVFSTIPVRHLATTLGEALDAGVVGDLAEAVHLNTLSLVFLQVDKPSLFDESWIFVPDGKLAFHRVSEQESFDPAMTPSGSVVCCEIMDSETRPTRDMTDEDLCGAAEDGLRAMGYRFEVRGRKVIRLPASYPVFRPGFLPVLDRALQALDRFDNLRTVGRQGSFNYIGTLDAMDMGYGAAAWFLDGRQDNAWSEERRRTSEYAVLD